MKNDTAFRLAGTATLGPKGQVVIPADVREQMNIQPGDKLVALHIVSKNAIAFITESQAQELVNRMGEQATGLKSALNSDTL